MGGVQFVQLENLSVEFVSVKTKCNNTSVQTERQDETQNLWVWVVPSGAEEQV